MVSTVSDRFSQQPADLPSQPAAQLSITIHKIIAVDPSHKPMRDPCRLHAWITARGESSQMTPLPWDSDIRLDCPLRSAGTPPFASGQSSQRNSWKGSPTVSTIPITISVQRVLTQNFPVEADQAPEQSSTDRADVQHIQLHYNPATNLFMGSGVIGRPGKPVFYISPYDPSNGVRQFQIWFSLVWQTPDAL